MTKTILAIVGGLIAIGSVIAKWLYDRYKKQPQKPRLTYVEKKYQEKKRELENAIKNDNIRDLARHSYGITDSVDRLRKADTIDNSDP